MNNKLKIVLTLIALALLFFLFPGKYETTVFNQECNELCKSNSQGNSLLFNPECVPVHDGCFASCVGAMLNETCTTASQCYSDCSYSCYGLLLGSCGYNNPVSPKVRYISELFD